MTESAFPHAPHNVQHSGSVGWHDGCDVYGMNTLSLLMIVSAASAFSPNIDAAPARALGFPSLAAADRLSAPPPDELMHEDEAPKKRLRHIVGAPCRHRDTDVLAPSTDAPRVIPMKDRVAQKRSVLRARQADLIKRWKSERRAGTQMDAPSPTEVTVNVEPAMWQATKAAAASTLAVWTAGILTGPAAPVVSVLAATFAAQNAVEGQLSMRSAKQLTQTAALLNVAIGFTTLLATGALGAGSALLAAQGTEISVTAGVVGAAGSVALLAAAPLASGVGTGLLTFYFTLDEEDAVNNNETAHVWVDGDGALNASLAPPSRQRRE